MFRIDIFLGVLTVLSFVRGIVSLWDRQPYYAAAFLIIALLFVLWLVYRCFHRSLRELVRGLSIIGDKVRDSGYQPDVLIAFNRSGCVVAGMLSVRLGVQEVIAVGRHQKDLVHDHEPRQFDVGTLMSLHAKKLLNRKPLITFLLMDTANTLREGLAWLKQGGVEGDFPVATIYLTPSTKLSAPNAIFA